MEDQHLRSFYDYPGVLLKHLGRQPCLRSWSLLAYLTHTVSFSFGEWIARVDGTTDMTTCLRWRRKMSPILKTTWFTIDRTVGIIINGKENWRRDHNNRYWYRSSNSCLGIHIAWRGISILLLRVRRLSLILIWDTKQRKTIIEGTIKFQN